MPAPVRLILAIHLHQPVGNMGHVFERACETCYEPYLDALLRHPGVRTVLHVSGPLVEWLERHRPKALDRIDALAARGSVEIIGGGWSEPLLGQIPEWDARRQIERTREYWRRRCGAELRGAWLTERVWEPQMAKLLGEAGVAYTIVDDEHLRLGGLGSPLGDGKAYPGWYVTEKLGTTLALFPSDMELRYAIPFRPVDEFMAGLKAYEEVGRPVTLTYGDDGEKFGMWPGTYEWVVEKRWLDRFFEAIEKADWVETATLSERFDAEPPEGRVYIPSASYAEMLEWSLPPEASAALVAFKEELKRAGRWDGLRAFVRGGLWDNFLAKYPESNLIHKRMLAVSREIRDAKDRGFDVAEAEAALHDGQCNCAYWHGLFGGLYLPFLREALAWSLARAEVLCEQAEKRLREAVTVSRMDYDGDGSEEILFRRPESNLLVAARKGGAAMLLEHRPTGASVLNVLARRREAYHRAALEGVVHEGAAGGAKTIHEIERTIPEADRADLVFDRAPRWAFQDFAVGPGVTAEAWMRRRAEPLWDGATAAYREAALEAGASRAAVAFEIDGPLLVRKTYGVDLGGSAATVDYLVRNVSLDAPGRFAVEATWFFTDAEGTRARTAAGGEEAEESIVAVSEAAGAERLALRDPYRRHTVRFSREPAAELWRYPVFTFSQSEGGLDRTLQGVAAVWLAALPRPGEEIAFRLVVEIDGP